MSPERALLVLGVTVPILYYAALVGTSALWPGYSHVRQYASELGSAASPHPEVFNVLIIAAGGAAVPAGAGFFLALKRLCDSLDRGRGLGAAHLGRAGGNSGDNLAG